jgi:omega-6 fatty acid desaturase (delta-12 desaturase)
LAGASLDCGPAHHQILSTNGLSGPTLWRAGARRTIQIGIITIDATALRAATLAFQRPRISASLGQIATSFGGFVLCCAAMYLLIDLSFWLAALPAVPAAGFLVRIFIIQHDCGHGAFFRSRRANDAIGMLCSLLTLTPYASWRRHHAAHHGNWNNLDRRESGLDVYSTVLTVAEYRALSPWARLAYRVSRHPLVVNVALPPLIFLLLYRTPFDMPKSWRRERLAVYATNAVLAGLVGGLGLLVGFGPVAFVQLLVISLAAIIGAWLFSIQHRFERARWLPGADWQHAAAALEGSSYLKTNRLLRWFTGNIGLHHVHHLNPRVPNYRLQDLLNAVPQLREVKPLGLWQALGAWRYVLWDEAAGRLVTFRQQSLAR